VGEEGGGTVGNSLISGVGRERVVGTAGIKRGWGVWGVNRIVELDKNDGRS